MINMDPSLSNIAVMGFDPRAMGTDICRHDAFFTRVVTMKVIMPMLSPILVWLWPNGFLCTPAKSASGVLRVAFDMETLGDQPKAVHLNGTDPRLISKEAKDEKKRAALWKDSISYANAVAVEGGHGSGALDIMANGFGYLFKVVLIYALEWSLKVVLN
jgi:hypothetical protein